LKKIRQILSRASLWLNVRSEPLRSVQPKAEFRAAPAIVVWADCDAETTNVTQEATALEISNRPETFRQRYVKINNQNSQKH